MSKSEGNQLPLDLSLVCKETLFPRKLGEYNDLHNVFRLCYQACFVPFILSLKIQDSLKLVHAKSPILMQYPRSMLLQKGDVAE